MSDVRVAIHQPNFIPWFPYFYKMAMVDKFVILSHVQFVRGYQNRYRLADGRWITKPVVNGRENIFDKKYTDGQSLFALNMSWINAIKNTLQIKTKLVYDMPLASKSTQLLIDLIKYHNGTIYVTNEDAKIKYLDEELMKSNGIGVEYCRVPSHLRKHTFEIFNEYGIEGAVKQLPVCKTLTSPQKLAEPEVSAIH